MDSGWKVHNDLCGSGHFPIILESLQPLYEDRHPHWKINKANWQVFETMCKQKMLKDPYIIDQTKYFTETLISVANETIAKTSASNKHSTPWFNDDCRTAIRLRKAALRKFYKEPTTNNLNAFKFLRVKTKINHKGSQEEKLAKLCQSTLFLHQNKHYLEDDEENIGKKTTYFSQRPHKKQNKSNYKERHSRHISWNIFRKFFHQQLQSTFPYFQKQCRETKTQLQDQ